MTSDERAGRPTADAPISDAPISDAPSVDVSTADAATRDHRTADASTADPSTADARTADPQTADRRSDDASAARSFVRRLENLVTGPELAAHLAEASLADLPDLALVDALSGWHCLKAWAAAGEAEVVAELARRSARNLLEPAEFLTDEIAATLALTTRAAGALVDRAAFLEVFPAVHDELAAGRLSERKVDVLQTGTGHLRREDAAVVLAAVLPGAPAMTAPGLRDAVRRADLAVDPARAEVRAARARADRSVWMEPAADSMAYLRAHLPAAETARVMSGLDAVAAAAAPEDERTLDQRRADALTDLVGGVLDRGVAPDGTPLPTQQGRRPHLQVTATLESIAGLTETPAELAGYGPVPASVAREIARTASWTPVVLDPRTGEVVGRSTTAYRPTPGMVRDVVDRDVTCTFPGCRVPARRCDLDHMTAFRPTAGGEQTRPGNLTALCRHHHRMKTIDQWVVWRDHATGVTYWCSTKGFVYSRDPRPAPVEPYPGREPRRYVDVEPPADVRVPALEALGVGRVPAGGARVLPADRVEPPPHDPHGPSPGEPERRSTDTGKDDPPF